MNISEAERTKLKQVIADILQKLMLPWANNRCKRLTAYHNPKKLFGIFSNETIARPANEKQGKPEWEMRLAGDLAFMTQDYANAFANYKKLLEKIQKTTNYEDIASCKEFMALSSLMTDYNIKEFKKNMENAAQFYEKANSFYLIARNALYVFDVLILTKSYIETAEYILRASQQVVRERELAAILLEQAAFCNIRDPYPRLRKFAHYMIHAGVFYFDQMLVENAIFCLRTSYRFYEKPNWPESLIYLCSKLGNALTSNNDLENSFIFYRKLLQITIDWKEESKDIFLKLLLQSGEKLKAKIIEDSSIENKEEEIKRLLNMHNSLEILPNSIEIFTSQDQIYCNDQSKLFAGAYDKAQIIYKQEQIDDNEKKTEGEPNNPQTWFVLGKMIDKNLSNPSEEMLKDLLFFDEREPRRKITMYCENERFVHVSEAILLKFVCKNPLGVELKLTKLGVLCHYAEDKDGLEIENKPLTFKPYEEKEVILSVIPKAEGELYIDGVQWEVMNLINGRYEISKIRNKADPIILIVLPKAGQLKIQAKRNLRAKYLSGELDSYTLTIKNIGTLPISKITFQTDFPLIFGWERMDFDWILNPNEEKEVTLNLRIGFVKSAPATEPLLPRILIRYLGNDLHYRYNRIEHCFTLITPFHIKKQFSQSYRHLNEYLLNIQITKLYNQNEGFTMNELCVVGDNWKIKEKERFTGFDKVYNIFVSLIQANNLSVPLSERRIIFNPNNKFNTQDTTLTEPYSNYIKEVRDARSRQYHRHGEKEVIVDLLATWTLFTNKKAYNGIDIIPINIGSYDVNKVQHSLKVNKFPLQVLHEYPIEIVHDFKKRRICKIPLKLTLKNISRDVARFRFEALGIQKDAEENFVWQGQTSKNFSGLEPNNQHEISLSACIIASGVYDLNRFSFTFYRNSITNMDLDPADTGVRNVIADIYKLELVQILVKISNA